MRPSYLKNAALLTGADVVLRLAGMGLRIWLANALGGEGMGLYQLVLAVYSLFVTLATSGVSVAATRLMAEELSRSRAEARGMLLRLLGAALLVLPLTADTAAAAALRSWLGRRQLEGGCLLTPPVSTGGELPARLVEIAAARADRLRRKGTAWAVVECTETAAALLPLYFRQGFGLRALRPLESLAPCFLLRTGCVPVRTAPVWVPLEDRVQLALLLAKGYAALDSRPYGGSLALALYPLKETE